MSALLEMVVEQGKEYLLHHLVELRGQGLTVDAEVKRG